MAQAQQRSFAISVPVEEPLTVPSFNSRVNAILVENQAKGFDIAASTYISGGSLPPHLLLIFVRQ